MATIALMMMSSRSMATRAVGKAIMPRAVMGESEVDSVAKPRQRIWSLGFVQIALYNGRGGGKVSRQITSRRGGYVVITPYVRAHWAGATNLHKY